MTKLLKSGWWYCNCDVPCNCNNEEEIKKKLNPHYIKWCDVCKERKYSLNS